MLLCFTVRACVVCNNLLWITLLSGVLAFSPAYRAKQGHAGAHGLVSVPTLQCHGFGRRLPALPAGEIAVRPGGPGVVGIDIQPLWCRSGLLARSVNTRMLSCFISRALCPQSTFKGRLRHFLDIVDPLTLLTSEVSIAEYIHHFLLTLRKLIGTKICTRAPPTCTGTVCLVLDMALPECGVVQNDFV